MASLINRLWSQADFWDKEENKKQQRQMAAPKAVQPPRQTNSLNYIANGGQRQQTAPNVAQVRRPAPKPTVSPVITATSAPKAPSFVNAPASNKTFAQSLQNDATYKFVNKNLAQPIVNSVSKTANTVGALAPATAGIAKTLTARATGNKVAERNALRNARVQTNRILTKGGGLGHQGAFVTPKQAYSRGDGWKGLKENYIKPTSQMVTEVAPLVIPTGSIGVGAGAKLGTRVLAGATQNAGVTLATDPLNQYIQNGKVDAGATAKNLALNTVLGGAIPIAGAGLKKGAVGVKNVAAKTADWNTPLNNAGKGVTNAIELRNAKRVIKGKRPDAKVTPKAHDPITYTQDLHNILKGKHPDIANQTYLDKAGHIRTLHKPDSIIAKDPRDVQYIKGGVVPDKLSRVSIKPIAQDGKSYIKTAHVVGGGRRSNKVLSAGSADPASPFGGRAENYSTLDSLLPDGLSSPSSLPRGSGNSTISALGNTPNIPNNNPNVNKQWIRPLDQKGFIQVGRTPKNIHPEDHGTMADFIDFARGKYNPKTEQDLLNLQFEASAIAERYGIVPSGNKNVRPEIQLAQAFEKRLADDQGKRVGMFATLGQRFGLQPMNQGGYVRVPGKGGKAMSVESTTPQAPKVEAPQPTVAPVQKPKIDPDIQQVIDAANTAINDGRLDEAKMLRDSLPSEYHSKVNASKPTKVNNEIRRKVENEIIAKDQSLQENLAYDKSFEPVLNENGTSDIPRLHIADIEHYFGKQGLENIPTRYKRTTGARDIDQLAARAGYDNIDTYVEAIQSTLQKRGEVRATKQALAEMKRDPLAQQKAAAEIASSKPQAPSEEDIASLMAQAEKEAPVTRQGTDTVTAPLKEAQKEAVLSGDIGKAEELRNQISNIESKTKRGAPDLSKSKIDESEPFEIKDIKGRSNKAEKDKFMTAANEYLGSKRSGQYTSHEVARNFNSRFPNRTEAQNLEIIKAVDNPAYKSTDPVVNDAVKYLHDTFDSAYAHFTKDKGIQMGYQTSYYPRMYKHPKTGDLMTSAEFDLLQRGSARQVGRTADMVNTDFLVTKDPADALTRYFNSLESAASGKKFLKQLETQGLIVRSSAPVRGMRPVVAEGMQEGGTIFYARPETAKALDRMFGTQEASGFFEKAMELGQGLNSFTQSLVLSGGAPNTPLNAFGIMQVTKSAMAFHPIQAGKAFFGSFSRKWSDNFFTKNLEYVKKMNANGYDTRIDYGNKYRTFMDHVKGSDKTGVRHATDVIRIGWDQLTNDATFNRFMPALEIMHYKGIYQRMIKNGMSEAQAATRAAKQTANFFGKNTLAKEAIRNRTASNVVGTTLFAPRFRESMINFWVKNAQALDPRGAFKNARSGEFNDNLKFIAAAAATYAAMDGINYALNQQHMWENPDGKKDKLLIPNGTNDGKTLGLPFLSSIATVPRNAAMGVFNLATGNFKEAGKNITSFASMPLKTTGEVLTNQDYFGSPIYDNNDSGAQKIGQAASYIAKSNMQPWVKQGVDLAGQNLPDSTKKTLGIKDKSGAQRVSEALELPVRFYDPKYFKGGKNAVVTDKSSVNDKVKQAFSSSEGKAMLALKNDTEREKQYPDLYKQYKAMQKGLSDTSIGNDRPKNYSNLSDAAKGYYDQQAKLTADGKKRWLTSATSGKTAKAYENINAWKPNADYPDLPNTNKVASIYAKFESDQKAGNWNNTRLNIERGKALREAYSTAIDDNDKWLLGASTAQTKEAIANGDLTEEKLAQLIAYDDLMIDLGGSAQISKEIRKLYGYGTGGTSRTGSARKSGGTASKWNRSAAELQSKLSENAAKIAVVGRAKLSNSAYPAPTRATIKKYTVARKTGKGFTVKKGEKYA